MDIISHSAWSFLAAKAINVKKVERPLRPWHVVFWGIAPDLFSFAIFFFWVIKSIAFGETSPELVPSGTDEPVVDGKYSISMVTAALYSMSHSIIIFFAIFVIVLLLRRRPYWEMLGWGLHILIDVPTHSYHFYPTPVLWPLSEWKFDGISWATPWLIIANYCALIMVIATIFLERYVIQLRKRKK